MENLTERQEQAARAIRRFISERGHSPTVREIAEEMRIDVRAAFGHILSLERKKVISREKGKSRSMKFTGESAGRGDTVELPVLGRVPAGGPLLVPENIIDTLAVGRGWFGKGEFFIVEVEGESMTGAHIMPGDYAVVKAQPEASPGDIVVAAVDGEATIKRFSVKNGRVTLLPENPGYEPVEPGDDFRVAGKVVGIIRKY